MEDNLGTIIHGWVNSIYADLGTNRGRQTTYSQQDTNAYSIDAGRRRRKKRKKTKKRRRTKGKGK